MNAPEHGAGSEFTFTVVTPAFNRAHTIHRVRDSLAAQTFRHFEWLIVDDGSTDDLGSLVEQWQREPSPFPIRYLRQQHQGKHIAFNRAVQEARGELLLLLDSDDACVPHALERFKFHWDSIDETERPRFSAVTALCVDQEGRPVGDRFPQDVTDSDSLEMQYRYHVQGEKWGFHRTEILRQYPFPEILHRQYVPESVVWSQIARRYKTRFVNEALRIYYVDQPSMVHGQRPEKNAAGGRLQHLTVLNEELDYFRYAPRQFMRSALHYIRFSMHTGRSLGGQVGDLKRLSAKLLWAAMLPAGLLIYWRDVLRLKK